MTDQSTPGSMLVNSVALTLIARGAMILMTGVGFPIALWMMGRAVESVDKISNKVDVIREQSIETNGNVKMIQQAQVNQTQIIADHETRMRFLENYNRRPTPP